MKARSVRVMLCTTSALIAASAAVAQTTPVTAGPETAATDLAADEGAITVTGSRIVRNGYDAPTPVSVITAAEIQQAAPTTIADFVNQLPALGGSNSPRSSASTIGGGTAGANLLNLRNLGPNRTLVLLNGRRVTPSTVTGAVDVNTLPQALVQRVDVVTGGASAAWGSDAVSGVVNFVLDTKFTGLKGQIQAGIADAGDAESITADISWGQSYAGGRGHFVFSANYSKQSEALLRNRDWYAGNKFLLNPTPGGVPTRLILPNSTVNGTAEGLIISGPLRGTAFNAAGGVATTNFQFGQVESGNLQSGGTQNYDMTLDVQQTLTPVAQGSVYARTDFELSDNISFFAEGSYGSSRTRTNSGYFWRINNEQIQIDNAFLPTSVRDRMVTAGITSFNLSHINTALGWPSGLNDRSLLRGLAGFTGTVGNWRWGASYQYGRTSIDNYGINNLIPSRILNSFDAVNSPNGVVCRSTLTNPTNGCVPYNPFGNRAATDAQKAYVSGTSEARIRLTQHVVEVNAQGDLFSLPAGAVTLAVGAEYRKDSGGYVFSDANGQAGIWYVANQLPYTGEISVKEAFGELLVPISAEGGGIGKLDLNGAARITDYSTSGSVTTWKVGGNWAPIRDIEFRATRSRDIRAPYLSDLFATGTTLVQFLTDPTRNNAPATVIQTTSGNRNLTPERADSLTAGVIVRPSFLTGLSASVDYYDIKIQDAIAVNSSQVIVNQCAAGNTVFCSAITRDGSGALSAVRVIPFNARQENARGLDIEVGYRSNVGPGTLDLRGLVNYVSKLEIVNPTGIVTRAGESGNNLGVSQGVPRVRALATVTYAMDPVVFQLKGRFIGKSKMEVDFGPNDQNINDVPAILYLDAFISYDLKLFGGSTSIFFAADNVLNTSPPVMVSQDTQIGQASGTNLLIYDGVGRTYRGGLRFRF
ncbi:TonB-dependent receptor plug domain-containing protein [Polymorphobacter sp.]|uniref:TonB-dependent receptor plug domain-containing protein n=1 Tax=Polymorphobacter sp. TaxID=1909290 RepID=UPI003F71B30C